MNKKQLAILRCGVDDWNSWREETSVKRPDLDNADLTGMDLSGANFSFTDMNGVNLSDTILADVSFYDTVLQGADLAGADLTRADLTHANLSGADVSEANLEDAQLFKTKLQNANLSYSYFKGAKLYGADMGAANLYEADNYILSRNYISGTQLNPAAKDPWSILSRKYTGPTMILTFFALLAAFSPYLAKALYWTAYNRFQISDGSTLNCDNSNCFTVLQLMLGLDRELSYLIVPLTLLLYNLIRGFLTLRVSQMRNEEDRTGYSPSWIYIDEKKTDYTESQLVFWKGYKSLYILHRIAFTLGIVATMAFIFNAHYWLSQVVWLPK